MAANLPTTFMRSSNTALIYKNGELSVLLINSHYDLPVIPIEISDAGFFTIQAAESPQRKQLKYIDKLSGNSLHQFCLMKLWSLPELIAGAKLLPKDVRPRQSRINEFFKAYGGSARSVFWFAAEIDEFPRLVGLGGEQPAERLRRKYHPEPYHASRNPRRNGRRSTIGFSPWQSYRIRPPRYAMYLLKGVDAVEKDAGPKLYRACEKVNTPDCRMWAAYLYDVFFHHCLVPGDGSLSSSSREI
ncbi:hypothetical protein MSAN_00732500 [Mycena sanguinolenta]|uniref:Uncharacterized protein n=1 Tax=Mycena sanguinolenta TaxID=230812 RepID=A0A8H6Z1N2_9AGAR|nr:hypothetical protein MSAN_00732500 [Mycena sanguinolenta]